MSPTDKSPHELFMEAAAVETAAMVWWEIYRGSDPNRQPWLWASIRDREYARQSVRSVIEAEARRLITESMETRHDG